MPRILFDQLSRHLMAKSSWHIKSTIINSLQNGLRVFTFVPFKFVLQRHLSKRQIRPHGSSVLNCSVIPYYLPNKVHTAKVSSRVKNSSFAHIAFKLVSCHPSPDILCSFVALSVVMPWTHKAKTPALLLSGVLSWSPGICLIPTADWFKGNSRVNLRKIPGFLWFSRALSSVHNMLSLFLL